MHLLECIGFDPAQDSLWAVGDLVNRGPKSLEVLRFFKSLGERARIVLGNHDLYLLMVSTGLMKRGKDDTLQAVLDAPDARDLLDWVARQPLMVVEDGHAMVHAGLLPQWDVVTAKALADEVARVLAGDQRHDFLCQLAGNKPARWADGLTGQGRLRCIVNAMTRMRFCSPAGEMEFRHKGAPANAPTGTVPWFAVPGRRQGPYTLLTGHWSALGLRVTDTVVSLDTGCLWGGHLTAYRLEDGKIFQVRSREAQA